MQIVAMFRRGIVVPRDDNAEIELRSYQTYLEIKVDFLEIETNEFFYDIWDTGLFQRINDVCGSIIDDYEEEILEPEQLESAILVVRGMSSKILSTSVKKFQKELLELMQKAKAKQRPVFFIL